MEAFNVFLDKIVTELGARGSPLRKAVLKGSSLLFRLENGKEITIPNLPVTNNPLLYAVSKTLDPKALVRGYGCGGNILLNIIYLVLLYIAIVAVIKFIIGLIL